MSNLAQDPISKYQSTTKALVFFGVSAVLFVFMTMLTISPTTFVSDRADLGTFDFETQIAVLSPNVFEQYPNRLYSPNDFANGITTTPMTVSTTQSHPDFATYRLVFYNLSPNNIYAITGYSATSAMTLWINGKIRASAGIPGDSAETMTPLRLYFTAYFTAEEGTTEIIIQRSSFINAFDGGLTHLYLGQELLINNMNILNHLRTVIAISVALVAALIFFGIFLFFKNHLHFLWFALSCFVIALRTLIMDYRLIMVLFPNMSWEFDLRLTYLTSLGFLLFTVLFIDAMFGRRLNRIFKYVSYVFLLGYSAVTLAASHSIFSYFWELVNVVIAVISLGLLLNTAQIIVTRKKDGIIHLEHLLVFIALTANVLLGIAEVTLRFSIPQFFDINFLLIGSVIFIIINVISLTINFRNTEAQLINQQLEVRDITERNELYKQLDALKSKFLANISHEMKTPLLVMGGYAQLSAEQLETGTINERTIERLNEIYLETQRLANLVNQLLADTDSTDLRRMDNPVDVEEIVNKAAAMCAVILEQNNNSISLNIEENCPPIKSNPGMVTQIFFNLLGNSNRHCHNSVVELRVENGELRIKDPMPGMVVFTVIDKGTGISPELVDKIFTRGVSGDSSTGLGLSICKETVEAQGGTISLDYTGENGTSITFALPIYTARSD